MSNLSSGKPLSNNAFALRRKDYSALLWRIAFRTFVPSADCYCLAEGIMFSRCRAFGVFRHLLGKPTGILRRNELANGPAAFRVSLCAQLAFQLLLCAQTWSDTLLMSLGATNCHLLISMTGPDGLGVTMLTAPDGQRPFRPKTGL